MPPALRSFLHAFLFGMFVLAVLPSTILAAGYLGYLMGVPVALLFDTTETARPAIQALMSFVFLAAAIGVVERVMYQRHSVLRQP